MYTGGSEKRPHPLAWSTKWVNQITVAASYSGPPVLLLLLRASWQILWFASKRIWGGAERIANETTNVTHPRSSFTGVIVIVTDSEFPHRTTIHIVSVEKYLAINIYFFDYVFKYTNIQIIYNLNVCYNYYYYYCTTIIFTLFIIIYCYSYYYNYNIL